MRPQWVTAAEAVARIPDGAVVATDGFTMMGVAEWVLAAIEEAHRASGHPRDLTVVHSAGQSNRRQGFEHFAVDGLVRRVVGSHWGLMPRMSRFLGENRAEAVCLPQGQLTNLLRAIAAGRPGVLTPVGRGTFVDPEQDGGRVNEAARAGGAAYVESVELHGERLLLYRAFPIDVGILRATAVDEDGNCSQEEEAVILDALPLAEAVRNSGGLVICQARRRVPRGAIAPRDVVVPGCLIDLVVLAPDPDAHHRQTDSAAFDPAYISRSAGGDRAPAAAPAGDRLAIGRRAIAFLEGGEVVNIGTGIPGDAIGPALAEAGRVDDVVLTIESGVYGGVPQGGTDFGISAGPSAIIAHPDQFDFYTGGGLDATFMGAGEIDRAGNVNVSRLGGRVIGCGGFIDITQSARRVYFMFSLDGRHPKFVEQVGHMTFSAAEARRRGQDVWYISDRAVLQLEADGLRLMEVADGPGVLEAVLAAIPFPVAIADPLPRMDPALFAPARAASPPATIR